MAQIEGQQDIDPRRPSRSRDHRVVDATTHNAELLRVFEHGKVRFRRKRDNLTTADEFVNGGPSEDRT